ncbi:hypothetical protein HK100_000746 [Physocladia obscura]|uniref:Uncharacterized protein n=1 Tax=Physocladia obscura TaxID=109957 RepID=A0AAD5XF15_9FUNG|nr:hypothetical protein HK100_000746 [Physocladia obscura]
MTANNLINRNGAANSSSNSQGVGPMKPSSQNKPVSPGRSTKQPGNYKLARKKVAANQPPPKKTTDANTNISATLHFSHENEFAERNHLPESLQLLSAVDLPVSIVSLELESSSSSSQLVKSNTDVVQELTFVDAFAMDETYQLTSNTFRPLLETSKKLVMQMQSLMGYSVQIEPTDAQNFTLLAQKLNWAFENQRAVNLINARLFALSYATNIFNFAKTRHLQKSLTKGKAQIVKLEKTVTELNNECETQRIHSEEIKSNLETVQQVFVKTMGEYRVELDKQAEVIKNQQPVIESIQKTKLRHDLFVDVSILIASLYMINSFLVEYPLHILGQVTMKGASKPRRKFSYQAAKMAVLYFIMKRLKHLAGGYGLHNNIGSVFKYLRLIGGVVQSKLKAA